MISACGLRTSRRSAWKNSAEDVFDTGSEDARRENLLLNGATTEEVEFLLDKRVELNALASDQMIAFLEKGFAQHGVKKIVPVPELVNATYRLFARGERVRAKIEQLLDEETQDEIAVPDDLEQRVRKYLDENPEVPWEDAVRAELMERLK